MQSTRRFHAYCVGTLKSGTHSIAELFGTHYRAGHEPESKELISMFFATWDGLASEKDLLNNVKDREQHLWLELNSSSLNRFVIDILVEEFADAKFILTIRDCYSWLDSAINHQLFSQLTKPANPTWQRMRDLRFQWHKGGEQEFAAEERILAQHGLYTLDGYLAYWTEHNQKILTTVPSDRLLVIRTHEISTEIDRIADFLNVPSETLARTKSHSFKARQKFHILSQIDRHFLNEKINTHCKSLMDEFFPDFNSIRGGIVSNCLS